MWFNQESLTLSIIIDPFAQIPPGAHITAYSQQSVPKAEQKPKVETPR
jgi:hypothetical protein